jgi:hypothetical protein
MWKISPYSNQEISPCGRNDKNAQNQLLLTMTNSLLMVGGYQEIKYAVLSYE